MRNTIVPRIVAGLLGLAFFGLGIGVATIGGCQGAGGSNGRIDLPGGSGTWDIWWCPDGSCISATQDGPPSPDAVLIAPAVPSADASRPAVEVPMQTPETRRSSPKPDSEDSELRVSRDVLTA
jgi:hypothetical protein